MYLINVTMVTFQLLLETIVFTNFRLNIMMDTYSIELEVTTKQQFLPYNKNVEW